MTLSLTPSSVTSSLRSMAAAGSAMSASQARISTGRRVNSAKDDGAAFAMATQIKSNLAGENVRRQNQLRAISLLDVTQSAVSSISDILVQMKEKALAASDTSLDTVSVSALNTEVAMLAKQIDQVVSNSTFNGKNLLEVANISPNNWSAPFSGYHASGTSTTTYSVGAGSGRLDVALDLAKVTASNVSIDWGDGSTYTANDTYGSPYTGSTVISHIYDDDTSSRTMTYNIATTTSGIINPKGFHIPWLTFTPDPEKTRVAAYSDGTTLNITHKSMSAASLSVDNLANLTPSEAVAAVDNAISVSSAYATYFAGKQSAAQRALALTEKMSDAFEKGYGEMVDADMARESANWQAQQTKMALSAQSLSIANETPKILLSLFRQ